MPSFAVAYGCPYPSLNEIRVQKPQTLLKDLTTALQNQEPDVVEEVSLALFTSFIKLLATFVGERLI